MKISKELLEQIIKEETISAINELDASSVVDFYRGGKRPQEKTKEQEELENFEKVTIDNWKQFLCLALKVKPEDEKIAAQMFMSKLDSSGFDSALSTKIFGLYARLSKNQQEAESFCSNNSSSSQEQKSSAKPTTQQLNVSTNPSKPILSGPLRNPASAQQQQHGRRFMEEDNKKI